jgi:predicted nicotinamide N-methyase
MWLLFSLSSTSISPSSALDLLQRKVGLTTLHVPIYETDKGPKASVLVPSSQDKLLDVYVDNDEAFGGRSPYFGIVWPSARALSRHLSEANIGRDATILEIGCGVGLVGLAAALTCNPKSVFLTDIDPLAVELSRMGAEANGVAKVCRAEVKDWSDLSAWPEAAFDCVLAADVIYEESACDAISALLAHVLRPGGLFILADQRHRSNRGRLWKQLLGSGESAGGAFALDCEELYVEPAQQILAEDEVVDELHGHTSTTAAARGQAPRGLGLEAPVVLARFVRLNT